MEKKHSGSLHAIFRRYFIDAMSYMALGLFSSLIIGLILTQLSSVPFLSFLKEFTGLVSASSPVVGAAIGVAVAYGLKARPLVIFSSAVSGAIGYQLGGPVGAYLSSVVGAEVSSLIAGKTPVDIVLVPALTIIAGGLTVCWPAPRSAPLMNGLGGVSTATDEPAAMGIRSHPYGPGADRSIVPRHRIPG